MISVLLYKSVGGFLLVKRNIEPEDVDDEMDSAYNDAKTTMRITLAYKKPLSGICVVACKDSDVDQLLRENHFYNKDPRILIQYGSC